MRTPHSRYRLYTSRESYWPYLRNLFLPPEGKGVTRLFEEKLSAFLDVPTVTTVPMCRTGIYLAIKHLIRPGQDVVMSPYTIVDAVNMVILAGGRPVFADIDRSSCNINPESIESLLHANSGAVLVTHLHGVPAPVADIHDLCRSKGIPVIEDTAQAFGARLGRNRLGTIADVGLYSFGMYKNINTWHGGAITCKDPDVFSTIKQEADSLAPQTTSILLRRMLQGLLTDIVTVPAIFKMFTYWIFRYGRLHDIGWINRLVDPESDLSRRDRMPDHFLRKMTPAQHALGLNELAKIDRDNRIRFENAAKYRHGLKGLEGLLVMPSDTKGAIYTYFPIQYGNGRTDRDRLLRYLARNGCDVGPQHLKNCADLPAFKDFHRDCPNARQTANSVILLPTYPTYPNSNIEHNIHLLRAYDPGRSY